MTHAITFDTFQYAKELKKVGFTEAQVDTQVNFAKKQTDNINDFIDDNIATKQDIKELELKMELIKRDLTIRLVSILGSMMVICIGVSTTILGFLIQLHH